MTGQGGVRPSEVLQVLLGDAEIPARLVRRTWARGSSRPCSWSHCVHSFAAAGEAQDIERWLAKQTSDEERAP